MAEPMNGEGAAAPDAAPTAPTAPTAPDVAPTAPTASTAPATAPEAAKPPPAAPSRARERSRSPRAGGPLPDGLDGKRSRFMLGPSGEVLHKWKVDYATRTGGGRAQCRQGVNCLQKDKTDSNLIEKGCLRIGRRVLMKDTHSEDGGETLTIYWSHAQCLFHGFRKAREDTRVITYDEDMDGFEDLTIEDKQFLRREIRLLHGERGDGIPPQKRAEMEGHFSGWEAAGQGTPVRRPSNLTGSVEKEPRIAAIKRSVDGTPLLAEGDRVWAYFKDGPMRLKSKKSELGIIRGVERDSTLVQFESSEEQEGRLERYAKKAGRPGRSMYRNPLSFGGPKQHLPKKWLDLKRPVPLLCGCAKQKAAHGTASGCGCTASGGRFVCGLDTS